MKGIFSRRAFVAGAPGAIAAAPVMMDKAAASLGKMASGFGNTAADTAIYAKEAGQQIYAEKSRMSEIYDNPTVQALRKQANRHDHRRYRRDARRNLCGGFDPDIAYLRSPSMGARIRMQEARDRQHQRESATLANRVEDKLAELAAPFGVDLSQRPRRAVDIDDEDWLG